ncbi:MAG: hypothetical protein KJN77_03780 [Gammaproteobacteria bacterium]|nr:hypothetical protein [Gammaproteobacteria bacterium]
MLSDYWTLTGLLGFLLMPVAAAQNGSEPDPFFQSDEIMDVRIVAPLKTIMLERDSGEEFAGKLHYSGEAGESRDMDIGIRARGRYRMQKDICRFAPLRLNFKKSQTKDSPFHKQDKVKLVTHCNDRSTRYQNSVLREYLAYRILNEITDISFRVRLLRITYVDTDGRHPDRTEFGFIVEHKDRLAKRLDLQPMDIVVTKPSELQPRHMNRVSLFHYLIGNTDSSPVKGSKDVCCHNHVLIGEEGDLLYSVPYDFDMAGLVNAPHAGPNPRFKLRSVKQRLYRGRCANNQHLEETIARYMEKRDAIFALVRAQAELSEREQKSILKYVSGFYDTIESPKRVGRSLIKKCI